MTLQDTPRNRTAKCPHCGQNMPTIRLGAVLTPILALIFDRVQEAGEDGIEANELRSYITRATGRETVSRAMNVRIHQLNKILFDVNHRIVPRHDGGNRKWRHYLKRL